MIGIQSNDSNSRLNNFAMLLAALVGISLLAVGGAVAAGDQLADETVPIDNSTEEVYLEVTNTSGDAVDYTLYGVDSGGITTEVNAGQISATANNTTQKTFAADTSAYASYRFVVTEDASDNDNETVESVDVGEIVTQSADGGGAILAGSGGLLTPLNIIIGVLAVAVAFLLGLFDPLKAKFSG